MQIDHHLARMSPPPTSEVLNRAADLIEERGWETGSVGWPGVGVGQHGLCLEGGIIAALGNTFITQEHQDLWACPTYAAVQSYLGLSCDFVPVSEENPGPIDPLWRWNDADGRTEAEVIATLRACAVIEASRERAVVSA